MSFNAHKVHERAFMKSKDIDWDLKGLKAYKVKLVDSTRGL